MLHCGLKHFGNTEVSQLNNTLLSKENVLALQVSMNNLSVVNMLHCETYLRKPIENEIFWKETASFSLALNHLGQVTSY
jgi:hypothetical protein